MQDEHSHPESKPKTTDLAAARPISTSPNRQITKSQNRDMFGGPWLGVIIFIVIAVGLGWGLTKLFQGMADQTRQTLASEQLAHGFDSAKRYTLKHDLLLGVRAGGDIALVPFKDDLPRHAPGRYTWPAAEQYAEDTEAYNTSHSLIGVVRAGTQVQFVEVIDDMDNPQTRILVMTRLLTGPYARQTAVLGMHLESADTDEQTGATRYVPREDLFEVIKTESATIQSDVPAKPPSDE